MLMVMKPLEANDCENLMELSLSAGDDFDIRCAWNILNRFLIVSFAGFHHVMILMRFNFLLFREYHIFK